MGSEEDRAGKMSHKAATDDNQPTHGNRAGLPGSGGARLLSNGVSKGRTATLWLTKSPAGDEGIEKDRNPESRGQTDRGSRVWLPTDFLHHQGS